MRWGIALVATVLVSAVAATASLGAGARPAAITGRLSQSGFTVIALGYNGKATTAKATTFSIRPSSSPVTLQLVDAAGKYAGPVVVGGAGGRVYEGVRAGAKLGTITVMNGYAVVAGRLASRFVDKTRWAHAVNGVPVANGLNDGLVRIAGKHTGSSAPGGDLAHSGVPNDISIDPKANGQIAALAPGSRLQLKKVARVADSTSGTGDTPPFGLNISNQLGVALYGTQNADIAGTTLADIDGSLSQGGEIVQIGYIPADTSRVELDCDGLSYCSPGGTGHVDIGTSSAGDAFPSCCNPSGDGFGQLGGSGGAQPFTTIGEESFFGIDPEATSEQIGTGDTMVVDVTAGDSVTQVPLTVPFVFITEAALDSWSDGAGHSGTIAYPPQPRTSLSNPGPPLTVAANAGGDVVLTLTWWRPQRLGIAADGEPQFMDVGNLAYSFSLGGSDAKGGPVFCDAATTMTTSDPNLSVQPVAPYPSGPTENELVDLAADQPANPANTLTASLDITKCLAAAQQTFAAGTTIQGIFTASTQTGEPSRTVVKFAIARAS